MRVWRVARISSSILQRGNTSANENKSVTFARHACCVSASTISALNSHHIFCCVTSKGNELIRRFCLAKHQVYFFEPASGIHVEASERMHAETRIALRAPQTTLPKECPWLTSLPRFSTLSF